MRRRISAAAVLAFAGCVAGQRISVTDAGSGLSLSPRPADCRVEFYRTKSPERAYEEVGTIHFSGGATPESAQEALRAKACELGADAVIVTRDYIATAGGAGFALGHAVVVPKEAAMTGTAVSYPELRQKHRLEHAMREAERRALEKAAEAAQGDAPPGFVAARTKRTAAVRRPTDNYAQVGVYAEIPAGQVIWVAPRAMAGWRELASGGHVEDDALELAQPSAAPPPQPSPPQPSPPRPIGI